ncbi:MAG: lysophospholipase [Pseudomonadales bacterium]|nr:lysophospholipase [Pseudomonadales bacterium]
MNKTRTILHGHSMGGCLAAHYAIKSPQNIEGVIFNSAALKVNAKISLLKRQAAMLLGNAFPFLKVGYLKHPHHMSQIPEEVARYKADKLLYHGKIDSGTGKTLILANSYVGENMEKMTVPFIALQGERDELVDPDGAKQLHSRANSLDKKLVTYPYSKHDLLHDIDHQDVYSQIQNWLTLRL